MIRPGCGLSRVARRIQPLSPTVALALALAAAAGPLAAGPLAPTLAPSGPEIQVSATGGYVDPYLGRHPYLAVFPDGGFVVVWNAPGGGIHGRLFDRDGAPTTGELHLLRPFQNTLGGVAAVGDGFVVVYDQRIQNQTRSSVFAAIFDRSGAFRVRPFKVHADSPWNRDYGLVAAGKPDGSFGVAWMGDSACPCQVYSEAWRNNHYDVFGRFFDAEGHPTTPELLVVRGDSANEGGTFDGPFLTAVSAARDGSMVFASDGPDGPIVVLARRSADGTRLPPLGFLSPRGPEGAYVNLGVLGPTIATAPDGSFTVAGTGFFDIFNPSHTEVDAVRFGADGNQVSGQAKLNFRGRFEAFPHLAYLPDGTLIAVWTDTHGRDGDAHGVYGRAFAADGTPLGPDFRVNSTTAGSQDAADLAATPDGNAIALFVSGNGGAASIVARFLRQP